MIETVERAPVGGVNLRTIASGTGWNVDAVDRSGCAAPRRAGVVVD